MVGFAKNLAGLALFRLKDKVVSRVVSLSAAHYLREACRMLNLAIDSTARIIRIEALLAGEKEAIHIEINGYDFVSENGADYLVFETVNISREWMRQFLETLVPGKRIRLPQGVPAQLLKTAM